MKRFLFSLALALLASTNLSFAQEIEVSVDRTELARGETLTYTIRVFDQRQGMQLDLTPLTENFDVLGTRTSSQIRSINGSVESWTDYIVTLFPLTEGDLEIPSLTINSVDTDPIAISVVNQGPRSNQSAEELFLEVEVNKDSVYVQEQLLFTVRLFYTINGIRNPQFTELEMPDTVIQLIGSPNQYERLIDGVRYGVYEKRYVIFPQRSGPLEIPDILFRGEVTDGSSNFVFRNLNTRRVTAFIDGLTIDVKERPVAAQNNDIWLPVTSLTLEESFDRDINNLQVGDSVVRTITMVAEGLDGAVLPPFSDSEIEGANVYPDPAEIDRTFVEGEIVGTRVEQSTIVAVQDGNIVIPEISIPWWNVDTDRQEATVVPSTRIAVAAVEGAVPSEQMVASEGDIEELLSTVPVVDQDMIDAQAQADFIEVDAFWLNALITLAFLIVLFSIYRLVLVPNRPAIHGFFAAQRSRIAEHYDPANNEGVAFGNLKRACRTNDMAEIREALILWCDHFLDSRTVASMEDILQQREVPELHSFATAIQAQLFNGGTNATGFDSGELLNTATTLRAEKARASKAMAQHERYALPPLYKT
ncbi:MAG: BatD family protein [Pseudomonadales bacterium]|nr:BatD family protein [Pseudomonadales bacterium]